MTRQDEDWDPRHLKRVRFFYGLVAGGIMTMAGVVVMVYDVLSDGQDWRILGFGAGLVLVGGVAALPNQFMPVLSAILKKLPGQSADVVVTPDVVEGGAEAPTVSGRRGPKPKRPRANGQ